MRIAKSEYGRSAIIAMRLAIARGLTGSAHASVITTSPSLPLIGVPYISPNGAGCFTVGVCVTPGPFVQTSAKWTIVGGNEEIVAQATYDATLTRPPPYPPTTIGSVSLTGTVEETVFGRTSNTEVSPPPFTTDISYLYLTGKLILPPSNPLDGATLLATLDGSKTSEGTTTITPDGRLFRIDSFFDVFIDVSIPGTSYSRTDIGPITLVAVPEPSTWAMLLIGFAGLGFAGWRRAAGLAG